MKTLRMYKDESGLSYAEMEAKIRSNHGGRRCRTTLHKAVNNPWRTKWPTFLLIAKLVGMPKEEARKQWLESKRAFTADKYKA